jgi:hypothetical protein
MRTHLLSITLAAAASASAGCQDPVVPTSAQGATITRADAVARAQQWVDANLLYCQSRSGVFDGFCNRACDRNDLDPAWSPYRSDCSGLISWAWGLPAPGRVTGDFAPFNTQVSVAIDASLLEPGDAVNNADHVMLFKAWGNAAKTTALFLEESNCTTNAKELFSSVSLNGVKITVGTVTYTAIRYTGFDNPPPPVRKVASDVDGDGTSDLVAIRASTAYVYGGNGGAGFLDGVPSFAGTLADARTGTAGWWLIGSADVTGDGRADLVGLHVNGTAGVWPGTASRTYAGVTTSFAGTMAIATARSAGHDPIGLADVTGDGLADLVTAHTNGNVYVYPGTASGAFAAGVASGGGTFDWALHDGTGHWPVGLGDVNGDGYADLVTVTSAGTAYVYLGSASGAFTNATANFAGTMHLSLADGAKPR